MFGLLDTKEAHKLGLDTICTLNFRVREFSTPYFDEFGYKVKIGNFVMRVAPYVCVKWCTREPSDITNKERYIHYVEVHSWEMN